MNRSVKGIAIAAAAMVVAGILLIGAGWMAGGNQPVYLDRDGIHVGGRDGSAGSARLESFSLEVEDFSSIHVDLDYYDVDLVPGNKFQVDGTFFSEEGMPEVMVENGDLIVREKGWKGLNINIDLPGLFNNDDRPWIRIHYPENTKLNDLVVKCDASDLAFENLTADKADFELDFGKLEINGLTAGTVIVNMDSGDCVLKDIKADDLTIDSDLGKITVDGAETASLQIDADSGEVSLTDVTAERGEIYADLGRVGGKNLTTKGLKVESNSGEVNLQGKLSGLTEISSDMGAVTVRPGAPRDQFNYELRADMGSVHVGGDSVSGSMIFSGTAENTLKIDTDMGSITVDFD